MKGHLEELELLPPTCLFRFDIGPNNMIITIFAACVIFSRPGRRQGDSYSIGTVHAVGTTTKTKFFFCLFTILCFFKIIG